MKVCINKKIFFMVFCFFLMMNACTNTPWHKEQAELFLNKGISSIGLRQYNQALKELLEAEKYSPNNYKIHYFLGMAYHGKGLKDLAIKEFKEAISLKDDYSEAHNYLGTLYSDAELWDQAIDEFDKALANHLYETPAIALYNQAWAYYSKKEYQTALTKYREALDREPITVLRPQIEKNIGLVYFDQSNAVEAIPYFKKSVELNAHLYDAYFFLGECYLRIKDNANAKKAFQAVIKLSPQSSYGQRAKNYLQSLK
jgi:type IV pilus assembly protein PilF